MPKLPHHCLIAVCLAGSLLLHCCASQEDLAYDYDSTALPEYDYNNTIEYSFFSNGSSEDLEKFLSGNDEDGETGTDMTPETDSESTTTDKNQASRTVYPCLLLTVVLTAHQMHRIL